MQTLVLNASYEPLHIITWQKAICLIIENKAELLAQHKKRLVRSISSEYPLPSIIRLTKYIQYAAFVHFGIYSRRNVFIRDKMTCQYCAKNCSTEELSIDHVTPQSKAGKDSWINTVTCCISCNQKKADMTPEEARMPLIRKPQKPHWTLLLDKEILEAINADDLSMFR